MVVNFICTTSFINNSMYNVSIYLSDGTMKFQGMNHFMNHIVIVLFMKTVDNVKTIRPTLFTAWLFLKMVSPHICTLDSNVWIIGKSRVVLIPVKSVQASSRNCPLFDLSQITMPQVQVVASLQWFLQSNYLHCQPSQTTQHMQLVEEHSTCMKVAFISITKVLLSMPVVIQEGQC